MSHLCNRRVREFLILARTWFAFGLPSKLGVIVDPLVAAQMRMMQQMADTMADMRAQMQQEC
jgi:hypothetical protein